MISQKTLTLLETDSFFLRFRDLKMAPSLLKFYSYY